jgi:glycosyltransferase involved in cell wall biosynthesis
MRAGLGLSKNDVIAGIVARVQPHRRFDILLKAVRLVVQELPSFKLIIIGRGTHRKRIAIEPAHQMGLTQHIIFTGYRTDDYVDILGALDFGIYLVPGSDGSCRAVREMMAMAKPVIVSTKGILPEIIEDGTTGLVIEDTSENLAQAILKLAQNHSLTRQLGENARAKALKDFSPESQVVKLEDFYSGLRHFNRDFKRLLRDI